MDWWEWKTVRARVALRVLHARRTRKLTQVMIADAGGLGQTDVSKLIHNRNKGPAVETFLRTLKGLGVTPSEFFAEIEQQPPKIPPSASATQVSSPPTPPPADPHSENQLALALGRQLLRLFRKMPR